jgi:hypothetical protein
MPLVLALVTAGLCVLLAPTVVNGDGLGYLKAAVAGGGYPGHLLYVPLLRLARTLGGAGPRAVDGLGPARALSVAAAAIAVAALAMAARRLSNRPHAAAVAAAGLGASFGLLGAGSDVESYAPALAALCLAVWALALRPTGGRRFTALAAAATAAAALLHIENLLFALPLAAALPRRERPYAAISVALAVAGAYALAGVHGRSG